MKRSPFPIPFGWFQVDGICPVQVNASVAIGAQIGVAAAGQGGANVLPQFLPGVLPLLFQPKYQRKFAQRRF